MKLTRRAVLGGLGAALALPWLEAAGRAVGAAPRRLVVFTVPNGMPMASWTPTGTGKAWVTSPVLAPLERHRQAITVVSGLYTRLALIEPHMSRALSFATGDEAVPWTLSPGSTYLSIDQRAVAAGLATGTALPSLELSSEGPTTCLESQTQAPSCAPYHTMSWAGPDQPLPRLTSPRSAFERVFGGASGSLSPEARARRARLQQTVVDLARADAARLRAKLGADVRLRLDDYLDGVQQLEQRLTAAEPTACADADALRDGGALDDVADLPAHAAAMLDVAVAALRCGATNVVTYQLGNERSERSLPHLGLSESHHGLSHHAGNADKLAKLATIGTWEVELFAGLLDRLAAVPEGDGTLLDGTVVLFAAPISDPNEHDGTDLPIVVAGGGDALRLGRRVVEEQPVARLHLTLLRALGLEVPQIAGQTEGLGSLV